jgi:hypothetical protein
MQAPCGGRIPPGSELREAPTRAGVLADVSDDRDSKFTAGTSPPSSTTRAASSATNSAARSRCRRRQSRTVLYGRPNSAAILGSPSPATDRLTPSPIVGFFLGLSAKRDIARTGQAGGGMATAGMVISAVHFAIYGLVLVVVLLITAGTCAAFMGSSSH